MEICKNCKWYEADAWKDAYGEQFIDNSGWCLHPNNMVAVTNRADNNNSVIIRIEMSENYYCPKYEKKA